MDDLLIIGAGWAGLAAAAFALEQGAKVRLIAQGIGSPAITPGWISVLDGAQGDLHTALADLVARFPDHPYALAGIESVTAALRTFEVFSAKIGLPYTGSLAHNHRLISPLGSLQSPAYVPPGYRASAGERPLMVGFRGWRDYYPALSGENHTLIDLDVLNRQWDAPPTEIARSFDHPEVRAHTADQVCAHLKRLKDVSAVGFPAVLGLSHPSEVIADLSQRIGLPVFEIATLPPSVPGTRLFNLSRRYLLDHRVRLQIGHPVIRGLIEGDRVVGVEVAAAGKPEQFRAASVILAAGGLYGGGLFSDDRGRVWEPIFGLPVKHEPDRSRWFEGRMMSAPSHPIHQAGITVNHQMQPLFTQSEIFAAGLYAAGHMLAHPTGAPSPLETYEGVALATAYRAVQCALDKT